MPTDNSIEFYKAWCGCLPYLPEEDSAMNETGVWNYIKNGMICTGWHTSRIESSAGNGIPDVSFGIKGVSGWIELKYIAEWPKRTLTKVKLPLRPEQKHWIKARGELSGNVWVICRIEEYFFILTWEEALSAYDGWTHMEWLENSHYYWWKRIDFGGLYSQLKGGCI